MIRVLVLFAIAVCSLAILLTAAGGLLLLSIPRPTDLKGCLTTTMFKVRLCPTDPSYAPLSTIPTHTRNAVLVSEDSSFYTHDGIDRYELQQSFLKNWKAGKFARGGSTITQQLAKNVYLSAEKSLWRKAKEILIAMQIEKTLTKNEILERYLNVVEFGPDVYGIKAAANYYFNKAPSGLTITESAFLAFLLPNPKGYSVSFRNKQLTRFANSQIRRIIGRLVNFRKIGRDQYESAMSSIPYLFSGGIATTPMEDEEFLREEGFNPDDFMREEPVGSNQPRGEAPPDEVLPPGIDSDSLPDSPDLVAPPVEETAPLPPLEGE